MPLLQIDPDRVELIKDAIEYVYGFDHPRPFQIEAVHHLAFKESSLASVQEHGIEAYYLDEHYLNNTLVGDIEGVSSGAYKEGIDADMY